MGVVWKYCCISIIIVVSWANAFANGIHEMQQKIISRNVQRQDNATVSINQKTIKSEEITNDYQKKINSSKSLDNEPNNNTSIQKESCDTRAHTRQKLLADIEQNWKNTKPEKASREKASIFKEEKMTDKNLYENSLFDRVNNITIPHVNFLNAPLSRVVATLGSLAEKNSSGLEEKNQEINFVLLGLNGTGNEPILNLNLKNISLYRVIEFVAKSSAFQFDITQDAVIFYKPDMSNDIVETQFFPVSRPTLIKLIGSQDINSNVKKNLNQHSNMLDDERAIKEFFQRAGVNFQDVSGSNLAFDGSQIIVTNTARNLKKIGNILKKYSEVKQVEIETKFLEVQQGVLDELGFRWQFGNRGGTKTFMKTGTNSDGAPVDNLRTLSEAFSSINFSRGDGKIVLNNVQNPSSTMVSNQPPGVPGQINLGAVSTPISHFTGVLNNLQCNVLIQALEQHTGSDLMSAPKLTVLSGKTAEIIVAMELRYPSNYGDIHSGVGSGVSTIGSTNSAGVTITAGTPKDFSVRNVGVEMCVTPTVEEDGSISLQLEPKVTEFEGFVEYGGMSVAVSSGATVSVPSGFYQPIFSTREIRTEVNIVDGTTVIMGGLTREEVKEVRDKVPILGDLPLLGKLFRSKSETTQKRNLLIFVTAHTISPFGYKNVPPAE